MATDPSPPQAPRLPLVRQYRVEPWEIFAGVVTADVAIVEMANWLGAWRGGAIVALFMMFFGILLFVITITGFLVGVINDVDTARKKPVGNVGLGLWRTRSTRGPVFITSLLLSVLAFWWLGIPSTTGALTLQVLAIALCASVVTSPLRAHAVVVDDTRIRLDRMFTHTTIANHAVASMLVPPSRDTVTMRLHDAREVSFSLRDTTREHREEVVAAIELATKTTAEIHPPENPVAIDGTSARWALLDRNGRSLKEWRNALAMLLRGDDNYRAMPLTRDDLYRLLVADNTPTERRLAAAFALWDSRRQGDDTETRIRYAAREQPVRGVRVVLESVVRDRVTERATEKAIDADRRSRQS